MRTQVKAKVKKDVASILQLLRKPETFVLLKTGLHVSTV